MRKRVYEKKILYRLCRYYCKVLLKIILKFGFVLLSGLLSVQNLTLVHRHVVGMNTVGDVGQG